MKSKWPIFFCAVLVLTGPALGQPAGSSTCYSEKSQNVPGNVFDKMEISPQFRGQSGFGNYLAVRIPFAQLAPATPGNAFTDTAQVRFILSPGKGMSDLTVTKAQGERFKNELNRAVKESACLWRPGGFSGREMTGWVVLNIYYTVERNKNKNDFSLHVGYELVNKFPGGNGQWNGK